MSAFVVHPEHIHVLLWAAQKHCEPANLTWVWDNPMRAAQLTPDTADGVGQMLIDANTAAVNHRRSPTTAPHQSCDYRYARPQHTTWSIIEVLHAIECYEYQCSGPDHWESSQAYAFCREMQRILITALPGYSEGPWAITPTSTPRRRRRT